MGRNYLNDLSDNLIDYYNKYLNSILHQQSDKPDFKNSFRHDPFALLSETKDLLKKKDLDERDLNILNSYRWLFGFNLLLRIENVLFMELVLEDIKGEFPQNDLRCHSQKAKSHASHQNFAFREYIFPSLSPQLELSLDMS